MIQELDAIRYVREHAHMFFKSLPPSGKEIVAMLAECCRIVTQDEVSVCKRQNGWWIIRAEEDWLDEGVGGTDRLFSEIVAFPEAGRNSMRPEILVSAFASDVITVGPDGRQTLKGNIPSEAEIWSLLQVAGRQRALAFRMAP